jgi:hypothetical protein
VRFVGATIASIALSLAFSAPAIAGPGDGSGTGSGGSDDGVLTATVTYTSGGYSGGGDGCSWQLADQVITVPNGLGQAEWPWTDSQTGITYHLWMKTCPGAQAVYAQLAESEPRDLLPVLLDRLRSTELPKPAPVFQMLDAEFGWAYVKTPLDFRAGGNSWRTVSVTASIGPLWATVTAVPNRLTFEPGDPARPGPVSCAGDAPTAVYVAEFPGECSYTYVNASSTSEFDGYHFQTSLTIDWSISWTSSTGDGGALAGYSTSSSALLAVAEVKGLVVCTGARPEQGGC